MTRYLIAAIVAALAGYLAGWMNLPAAESARQEVTIIVLN